MAPVLLILTILMSVLPLLLIAGSAGAFRRTTLVSAWCWGLAAAAAFALAGTLHAWGGSSRPGNAAWYAVAILGLCPLISVLGARRPGAGAWNWFVVLPLIAVLLWPVTLITLTQAAGGPIDVPPFLGFVLVLGMGCGNYLWTRYWLPAGLYFAGELLLAAPITDWGSAVLGGELWRSVAIACWSVAILLAWLIARRPPQISDRFDRVWFDFRSAYGVVWELRAQRRLNERGEVEAWSARLQSSGFAREPDVSDERRAETEHRIEHALRWLLRRFVDDGWLNERLNQDQQVTGAERTCVSGK